MKSPRHSRPSHHGSGSSPAASEREGNPLRRFLRKLGPGLVTGAADDDPSGIGTYAAAGASLGYTTLWTALLTLPMMAVVQYVCAKIGMVSGTGLASVIRRRHSRWLLYPVLAGLVLANTINAGTDLLAIAAGVNLLAPIPVRVLVVPIALLILVVQIWGSYRLIARTFKWLTLALFAYVGAAFYAHPRWGEVLVHTLIPTLRSDPSYLLTLVAIFGTTISPYLFFWQANQEVEEEISMGRKRLWQRRGATDRELRFAAEDVGLGMVFCNLIFFFVILTTAATLHAGGQTRIDSAADAAEALRPIAGDAASLLFAFGIIGAGLLAVPVLTGSAAYALAEAFGWKLGLDQKPGRAKAFYAAITASTLVGLSLDFTGLNPMRALFWTAVLNGFLAPPLLIVVMRIANDREVMGERVNGAWTNAVGWATVAVMLTAAAALVVAWLRS